MKSRYWLPWTVALAVGWLARQAVRSEEADEVARGRYAAWLEVLLGMLPVQPRGVVTRWVRDKVVAWIYTEQARLVGDG